MLQVKQHAWRVAGIAFVHQHGTTAQKIAVTFQCEIEHRVKQRMTRTNKSGERLSLGRYERLFEGDTFISLQDRLADADQAISIADGRRNVGDFVTARFTLAESTAELFKSFEKK